LTLVFEGFSFGKLGLLLIEGLIMYVGEKS